MNSVFTLRDMAKCFQSAAWSDHWTDGSELHHLLKALPLQEKAQQSYNSAGDINVMKMSALALGFLWCKDNSGARAKLFS